MSSPNIQLRINNKILEKTWTDISVKRSMESLCSTFNFMSVQETPNFDYTKWPIQMGKLCEVLVDGTVVLTGYIEDINIEYTKDLHTVQVSGRDKTCDLVDCHHSDGPYEFGIDNKVTVLSICESLCSPFDIDVVVDSTASAYKSKVVAGQTVGTRPATSTEGAKKLKSVFYVMPGESIAGALYKITRWAGIFMLASTDGNILLTLNGTRQAAIGLELGVNIIKGGLKQSNKECYSVYRVKGYGTSTDNLARSGEWIWLNGRFPKKDPTSYPDESTGATRYRPFGQLAENAIQIENANNMAQYEAQYRVGSSRTYSYTVRGWHEGEGSDVLWEPNTYVAVTDGLFGLDDKILFIEAVEYTQSAQGSLTNLSLCDPEKYTALAQINQIKTIFDQSVGAR